MSRISGSSSQSIASWSRIDGLFIVAMGVVVVDDVDVVVAIVVVVDVAVVVAIVVVVIVVVVAVDVIVAVVVVVVAVRFTEGQRTSGNTSLVSLIGSLPELDIRLSSEEGRGSQVAMETSPIAGVEGIVSVVRVSLIMLSRQETFRMDCSLSEIFSQNRHSYGSVTSKTSGISMSVFIAFAIS